MRRQLLVATALGMALACRDEAATGPGHIEVMWTGADTGQLRAPGFARWCANDSLVEITGAAGDSGVALAVLPRDTVLTPGTFQVVLPLPVVSRPTARVAIRWPSENFTEGYYGLSGTVTVDSGSSVSGRLEATLRNANDGGEISMSGTFRELRIQPGSAASCGLTGPPPDGRLP